ncbi:hypothetical protein LguiB_011033 [Lonicera macranthoides]
MFEKKSNKVPEEETKDKVEFDIILLQRNSSLLNIAKAEVDQSTKTTLKREIQGRISVNQKFRRELFCKERRARKTSIKYTLGFKKPLIPKGPAICKYAISPKNIYPSSLGCWTKVQKPTRRPKIKEEFQLIRYSEENSFAMKDVQEKPQSNTRWIGRAQTNIKNDDDDLLRPENVSKTFSSANSYRWQRRLFKVTWGRNLTQVNKLIHQDEPNRGSSRGLGNEERR